MIVIPDGFDYSIEQEKNQNISGSGIIETINQYGIHKIKIGTMFDGDNYNELLEWWSWARQGKPFAFAMDTTRRTVTALSIAAAAGQKTIVVDSGSELSAEDYCFLKAQDNDDEFEVIEIDSITGDSVITAVDNLMYSYSGNDLFKDLYYWPKLVSMDKTFNPTKIPGIDYYKHVFEFEVSGIILPLAIIWQDTNNVLWQDTNNVIWQD